MIGERTPTVVGSLSVRLAELVATIERTDAYRTVFARASDPHLASETMKQVYRDIATYQPHVTEATFTAVGRMPKRESMIRAMILQQVEEVEHAEMARRDFLRLGGRASDLDTVSPEGAAVAATCRFLAERCQPASYLGFMYIFEALTPIMAARAQAVMSATGYDAQAREFVDLHAVEDVRHTDQVIDMITELVSIDPAAEKAIVWGFDVFAAVYPVPLWSAAYRRAVASVGAR
jgi:hypothetical protein